MYVLGGGAAVDYSLFIISPTCMVYWFFVLGPRSVMQYFVSFLVLRRLIAIHR